jgi:hypothetical protein
MFNFFTKHSSHNQPPEGAALSQTLLNKIATYCRSKLSRVQAATIFRNDILRARKAERTQTKIAKKSAKDAAKDIKKAAKAEKKSAKAEKNKVSSQSSIDTIQMEVDCIHQMSAANVHVIELKQESAKANISVVQLGPLIVVEPPILRIVGVDKAYMTTSSSTSSDHLVPPSPVEPVTHYITVVDLDAPTQEQKDVEFHVSLPKYSAAMRLSDLIERSDVNKKSKVLFYSLTSRLIPI